MKKRNITLLLLVALAIITFLDRISIAVAGPRIQDELHIPPEQWGWILGAFVLAYGLFEIPTGALGDRAGHYGRRTGGSPRGGQRQTSPDAAMENPVSKSADLDHRRDVLDLRLGLLVLLRLVSHLSREIGGIFRKADGNHRSAALSHGN